MPYTPEKPTIAETSEQLRARIPGWGADLDPADRPSVPRERFDPSATGAWWDIPEQQPEKYPRERSVEHGRLTPVFGTATPPRGVSGAIRRLAYKRYSEGRAAHWLLLVAADRVDAAGSTLGSVFTRRPDNLIAETGVLGEVGAHPVASRTGNRVDVRHQALDPIIVAGPWVLAGGLAYVLVRSIVRRRLH
ncbi:hypothetical protein [Actinoplanes sp. RD1]|uniref:hypothetical protein n=1 Tax=Actinoplanes sp. RD1 TaxID=3064538 RepID=UPI0027408771|nr:hypothetical protein [Actinoplanes sp. RD1]